MAVVIFHLNNTVLNVREDFRRKNDFSHLCIRIRHNTILSTYSFF